MARTSKTAPEPLLQADYPEDQELLPAGLPAENTSSVNEINLQVQHVKKQLLDLERQQEEVERQRKELEELSRKQKEFDEGRREIVEKLTRGVVLLERKEFEVKRELEAIKNVRDSFREHLAQTETLNPAEWNRDEMPSELTRSLACIDQAKAIYNQSRARLAALRQNEEGAEMEMPSELGGPEMMMPVEKSFGAMVRDGFAYSLPVLVVALVVLVTYILLRH